MALRSFTKHANVLPKFCLVYFKSDQTTSIVEVKKLRNKETGEAFLGSGPEIGAEATVRCGSKFYAATIIALNGK